MEEYSSGAEPRRGEAERVREVTMFLHKATGKTISFELKDSIFGSCIRLVWPDGKRGHCFPPQEWLMLTLNETRWTPIEKGAPDSDVYQVERAPKARARGENESN